MLKPPDDTAQSLSDPDLQVGRRHLRQRLLAERAALDAATVRRAAMAVAEHLRPWFAARPPASVGFCAAVRGEIDLAEFVGGLIEAGWSAAMPVVERTAAPMVFRAWTPLAPMTRDRHGIPVPATASCPAPTVLLIPVLGVDRAGHRLGYGGGYFDRTVAALAEQGRRPLCIGVGYDRSWINDLRPAAHDARLDSYVSPQGLHPFPTRVT